MFHLFQGRHGRRFARGEGPGNGRGRHGHDHDHGPNHGPERGERGGRGGLGRFFAHGDLRLLILQLIAEKPRHGYEIIKEIEDRVAGAYTPSPGVIYPTLTLLEELGHIAATPGEGSRKAFAITPEGQAFLDGNRPALDVILARIEGAGRTGGGPGLQVMRAMHNLRLALRLRFTHGPLTQDQAQAIAAALDAAAVAVERT